MPQNNPSTDPNILDIILGSILGPLKHKEQKPKSSSPLQKPPIPSSRISKSDSRQKTHHGPQPTQSQKTQASKNDDFNFFTWLLFPEQSTKSTQAQTNQTKSTTTNTKTKKQVRFTSDVGNYNGKEGENSTYDDELQKLANISNEVNPGQGTTTFETPICSAKENLIFIEALKKLQAMAEDESPEQRQARIIQEFLDFFECKMDKKEFDNFQKLFSFGLSCETNSGTSNQDDIEIARDEINKFVIQIDSFHHGFTDEFSEIANKSIDGLTKYLANQKSSIDAKTKPPELSQILENFYNELLISNSFFYDKKDIVQGLLDPDIEDSFFWQHFSITQPGDSYQPGKSMVLERAEELLKFHVSVLKRNSENSLNNELISSFLDSQEQRGIKALHERFSYFGTHSPTSPSRHFSPLTTKLPFSLSPDIRSAIC